MPITTEQILCDDHAHMVELALVFGAAFEGVDAGGVDACVSEEVGEA